MKKLTQEEIEKKLNNISETLNITIKKPFVYKNVESKIKVKCNLCDNEWVSSYHHLIRSESKCTICNNLKTKKLTYENIIEKINNKNPKIKILDDNYINSKTKLNCLCLNCGNKFNSSYSDIINSSKINGCIKCEKKKKINKKTKTTDEFKDDLYKVHKDNIIVLSEYIKSSEKIKVKCNICDNEWNTEANGLLKGYGCPKCGHEKNRNSTVKNILWLKDKIINVHENRIKIIDGVYHNLNSIFKVKCNLCENEWYATGKSLKQRGCPNCNLSKGELKIKKILDDLGFNFICQYKIDEKTEKKGITRFDFYIKDINTVIEYDGKQHFEPINVFGGIKRYKQQKEVDSFKDNYCIKNNIRLIRIGYYEYDKIDENYIKKLLKIKDGK